MTASKNLNLKQAGGKDSKYGANKEGQKQNSILRVTTQIETDITQTKRKVNIQEIFSRFPHVGEQILENLDNQSSVKSLLFHQK